MSTFDLVIKVVYNFRKQKHMQDILDLIGAEIDFVMKSLQDIVVVLIISVPLSLILYIMFNKNRKWVLIDLGQHKWIIK
jgi:hypothetical protein